MVVCRECVYSVSYLRHDGCNSCLQRVCVLEGGQRLSIMVYSVNHLWQIGGCRLGVYSVS
jgi:hypothetical protein